MIILFYLIILSRIIIIWPFSIIIIILSSSLSDQIFSNITVTSHHIFSIKISPRTSRSRLLSSSSHHHIHSIEITSRSRWHACAAVCQTRALAIGEWFFLVFLILSKLYVFNINQFNCRILISYFTFLEYNASRAGSDGSRRSAVRWLKVKTVRLCLYHFFPPKDCPPFFL